MSIRFLATIAAAALAACGQGESGFDSKAVAAEIEREVAARHPGAKPERHARFYARMADGSVRGIWAFANEGIDPIVGKAGEIVWTLPNDLPLINDGGCAVLNIEYDLERHSLRSFSCNGDA